VKKKILVVAAHPDDEILGCGGTTARLVKEGAEICTAILGEGITAREEMTDRKEKQPDIDRLKMQVRRSNEIIGTENLFVFDFPDNRFDQVPLLDIVKKVENVKKKIEPDIIFTHFKDDLNCDHRITYQAVLTAARPLIGETVREIYSFEILSSSEWNYPSNFTPNLFFDIEQTFELKQKALKVYEEETRDFPHPRSLKGIEVNALNWGMKSGCKYAEAFEVIRILK
jgi:LmbE family N-acetylglucosaminyl deacetylase